MKRKYDNITEPLKATYGKPKKLTIQKPLFLRCEVCHVAVFNYHLCKGNCIYCSYDCYAILQLSKKDDYLDMKRSKSFEDLMEIDK